MNESIIYISEIHVSHFCLNFIILYDKFTMILCHFIILKYREKTNNLLDKIIIKNFVNPTCISKMSPLLQGVLSVGIPGELKGLEAAHQKYGK